MLKLLQKPSLKFDAVPKLVRNDMAICVIMHLAMGLEAAKQLAPSLDHCVYRAIVVSSAAWGGRVMDALGDIVLPAYTSILLDDDPQRSQGGAAALRSGFPRGVQEVQEPRHP